MRLLRLLCPQLGLQNGARKEATSPAILSILFEIVRECRREGGSQMCAARSVAMRPVRQELQVEIRTLQSQGDCPSGQTISVHPLSGRALKHASAQASRAIGA